MDVLAGPFLAAAALLVLGGVPKAVSPGDTARALRLLRLPVGPPAVRVLGAAEVVTGVAAVVWPGRPTAALIAIWYAGFAGVVALALRSDQPLATCGCFGGADTPPTLAHLAVVAAASLTAMALAVSPVSDLLSGQAWLGLPFVAMAGLAAWFAYLVMSRLAVLR
ncbi:MAG TPA: MauE/DoxX family redox-associated membrane protein [Mycobacteriales bacterium]|nr:MauE/DoxX family redox-associated membrane protein [Mycobacteriales bacterium]